MSQKINSQNYKNHRMISKPYHMALIPYTFATMVLATIYFVQHSKDQLFLGGLILLLACGLFSATFWSRVFAIKVQDRAIRAEESLRYRLS